MKTHKKPASLWIHGLTRLEILAIIAGVVLVAVVALLPALAKAKERAQCAYCNNFLKQVGLAFRTWEGDHGNKYPMSVSTNEGGTMESMAGPNMFRHFQVMSNELSNPFILICPADDRRPAADFTVLRNTNLGYFLGLDADESSPNLILSGDRSLATNGTPVSSGLVTIDTNVSLSWSKKMHMGAGNVGMADGSVQQVPNDYLPILFQQTRTNLLRLALP